MQPQLPIPWMSIVTGIVVPLIIAMFGAAWKIRGWIHASIGEVRKELADQQRQIDSRFVVVETFMRQAPHEFADREDFNREALLLRNDVKAIAADIAELRGGNSALVDVGGRIASALENVAQHASLPAREKGEHS